MAELVIQTVKTDEGLTQFISTRSGVKLGALVKRHQSFSAVVHDGKGPTTLGEGKEKSAMIALLIANGGLGQQQ